MGGAADLPHRSSSPLKRPASELEQETPAKDKEDVDMDRPEPSNGAPDATGAEQTTDAESREPLTQDTDVSLPEADEEIREGMLKMPSN